MSLGDDGNLYGTNPSGGTSQLGSVFRLSPAGVVKVIFSGDFAHGTNFVGGVTPGNDGLFSGTTSAGGSGSFGVVYKVTTAGKFTELHGFGKDLVNDGFGPYAGVVAASDGKFYGATANGETGGSVPNGNLFSVTSSGNLQPAARI